MQKQFHKWPNERHEKHLIQTWMHENHTKEPEWSVRIKSTGRHKCRIKAISYEWNRMNVKRMNESVFFHESAWIREWIRNGANVGVQEGKCQTKAKILVKERENEDIFPKKNQCSSRTRMLTRMLMAQMSKHMEMQSRSTLFSKSLFEQSCTCFPFYNANAP